MHIFGYLVLRRKSEKRSFELEIKCFVYFACAVINIAMANDLSRKYIASPRAIYVRLDSDKFASVFRVSNR